MLGADVLLGDPTDLGGDRARSQVLRVPLLDGPAETPESVVVKVAHADPEVTGDAGAARARFVSERDGLAFLGGLSLTPPVSPRLYGADPDLRLLVLEDLGDGTSLADLLTGDNPATAAAGLNAYARSLGRLHAATQGREPAYVAARSGTAGAPIRSWAGVDNWSRNLERFAEACRSLDIDLDAGFGRETQIVGEALERPGPFLTFNISDACPDNNVIAGDTVRFFDFEFCGYGHALLDGACLRLPFPSCWCVAQLPATVASVILRTYRAELIVGCQAAADDQLFDRAMLCACAHWTIGTVSWTLQRALKVDDHWGLASHRQRHVYRLEKLATETGTAGFLESIGDVAARLARTLRTRWDADALDIPLYPAFC